MELGLLACGAVNVGAITIPEPDVREMFDRINALALAWRDRRKVFVDSLLARFQARRRTIRRPEVVAAANEVWPSVTAKQAWTKQRKRAVLEERGAPADLVS